MEALQSWLKAFPLWEGRSLGVDSPNLQPDHCTLFPLGEQELSRKEDVVGKVRIRYRKEFVLRRVLPAGETGSQWMEAFSQWAKTMAPPPLGQDTILRTREGRLKRLQSGGLATYEIKISMEYTEEWNNGEN